jgi:hypothetical protein
VVVFTGFLRDLTCFSRSKKGEPDQLNDELHDDIDILEREDLEEWAIREPSLE